MSNSRTSGARGLSRRRLLEYSALGALGLIGTAAYSSQRQTTIQRIDLLPVRYPTEGYFKFFTGPGGAYGRAAVVVKIITDDDAVGWGQSIPSPLWSYETLETVTSVLRDYLGPALIGRNPLDIGGAHRALDRALAPGFSTAMPIARAGLDAALHDLAGRMQNRSLSQMWNRPSGKSLDLSWTINARTLDEAEATIDAGFKRGYRHFNIKVAPNPEFDVALAKLVRRCCSEGFLWADANGGYDRSTALAVAPKLADAGVDVLEAPLRPNRLSGYQALKQQGALPILMDEGVVSPVELSEFIRLGMLDGVAMKACRCGGLRPARQQIEMIREAGLMWLGSGLTDPDISMAAALALYGAYGLEKPAALNGPQFLKRSILTEPLKIENGSAAIPSGPGLGVDVDEAKVVKLMKETTGAERVIL